MRMLRPMRCFAGPRGFVYIYIMRRDSAKCHILWVGHLGLSLWLSGLICFLSHSTCWAYLADDLQRPGIKSVGCQLVGLMAGML